MALDNVSQSSVVQSPTIIQPNSRSASGTIAAVGERFKSAHPHHELLLGVVAIVAGLLLPFLGLVLALVTLAKGLRQARVLLLALGLGALLGTLGGSYGYYRLYRSTNKPSSPDPTTIHSNSDETIPLGSDSIDLAH